MTTPCTPLEPWIARQIGKPDPPLDPVALRAHQLAQLNETLSRVQAKSRHYRRSLGSAPIALSDLGELAQLPFTTADDLRAAPLDFVCLPQHEVERIVTLPTSGTTGSPKRIYFSALDQESTTDFFHHGMSTLVGPGDRVLILLPGSLPGSVGALLREGLARMEVEGIVHGPVTDPAHTLQVIESERVTALVGIPIQVLSLIKTAQADGLSAPRGLKAVLLSTDRLPHVVTQMVEEQWGCEVYDHYGTTEMGLGGGVDCRARAGYHLREADLLFEIVEPTTGQPVPEGEHGEVVFSTLTREAMPLLRYRTGDLGRFVPGPCPCGTTLKRLAHIDERVTGPVTLPGGQRLRQADFDEALLPLDGLVDFKVRYGCDRRQARLVISIRPDRARSGPGKDQIMRSLAGVESLADEMRRGRLTIDLAEWDDGAQVGSGTSKRKIDCLQEVPA